jgi:hypothetical protein
MRRFLACGFLLVSAYIPAFAVNFSGKWALQNAAGRGGGRGGGTILTLNQVGDQVTGTVTLRIDAGSNSPVNNEIWAGRVAGDTISFYVWTGSDQPAKTSYRGTMSASGDEIVFTVTGGRGVGVGFGGFAGGRRGGGADGQTATGQPGGAQPTGGQAAPPVQGVAGAPGGSAGTTQQITAQRVK